MKLPGDLLRAAGPGPMPLVLGKAGAGMRQGMVTSVVPSQG